ncbi:MAG: helix-turn-helix transcriptional regulator [Prevotella sp.]|nr:helix-turn-helix transcriptional regulator [Prevotella sp.]
MKNFYTHEEMLDTVVGEKGTKRRDQFEAKLKSEIEAYKIGMAIKYTRQQQQLTQKQLGERMGVQEAQVSKIESGRSITFATIVKAFKALGVKTASLDLGSLGRVALW